MTSVSFSVEADSINNPNDPLIVNLKKVFKFNFVVIFIVGVDVFFGFSNDIGDIKMDSYQLSVLPSVFFPFFARLFEFLGIDPIPRSSMNYFYNVIKNFKDQHHADETVSIVREPV